MREIRYSLYTCSKYLGITAQAVRNRALRLGIDTEAGVTATDLKQIKEYKNAKSKYGKGSLDELKAEMEALG